MWMYTHHLCCTKHLQLLAAKIFCKSFPFQESVEDFTLVLENIHSGVVSAVVDEGEKVFSSTHGFCIRLSTEIAMDKSKGFC